MPIDPDSEAATAPLTRRRVIESAGGLAAAGTLAGCTFGATGPTSPHRSEPIRIGATLPFSGFLAAEGAEMLLGMEFWREEVHATGGLLGRPVEFVIYDDGSTRGGANAGYARLVEEDRVDLVMGTAGTLGTAGAIEALEPRGMPGVFPMAWGPLAWDIDREWCVPYLPIARDAPRHFVRVLSELDVESFAIIRSSAGYASDFAEGLKGYLDAADITLEGDVTYPRGDAEDRRAALERVASFDAEVIGVGGSVAAVKPLIRAIDVLEIDARGFAWTDFDDTRLLPLAPLAEGMLGIGFWVARAGFPGNDRFVERFAEWASVRKPDWPRRRILQHHSPAAYGGAVVLQQAVESAGSLDPPAVRDALWDLKTETIFGRFEVDDDGYQIGKRMLALQFQRQLREIVWPPRLQTAEPRLPTLERVTATSST